MAFADLGKKRIRQDQTYAKLKYDRQIVAIAKSRGIREIYTNDPDIVTLAKKYEIGTIGIADMPLPPPPRISAPLTGQGNLFTEPAVDPSPSDAPSAE